MEKEKRKELNNKNTFKSYIKDLLLFIDKDLKKYIGILLIGAILLCAIFLSIFIPQVQNAACEGICRDDVTIGSEYWSKLQVLLVTTVAGIVPYMFAPVVGFLGYLLAEISSVAYIIKGYGYFRGILAGLLPLILNVISISIVTAIGIYLCKTITVGYKLSNLNNMNFLNFRLRLYETIGNKEKLKRLQEIKDKKNSKLNAKKEKTKYLPALGVFGLVCIIQFISVLIQEIIL